MPSAAHRRCSKVLLFLLLAAGLAGGGGTARAVPYRLGFAGKDAPGGGVEVVSVNAGSPAMNLHRPGDASTTITLTPGDVITAVDGKPVGSLTDYYHAMNAATPGKVRLAVRDSRNGQVIELVTPGLIDGGDHNAPRPALQEVGGPPKIFLVDIALTNDKHVGNAVGLSAKLMASMFEQNVPGQQLRIIHIEGDQVKRETILGKIRGLGGEGLVAGRDVLVVYYAGHGAYNLSRNDHLLDIADRPEDDVYIHYDLKPAIRQAQPRSAVILCDACSVLITVPWRPVLGAVEPEKVSPLVRSLFIDVPPGTVAICGSMKGQMGGCNSKIGCYFTFALGQEMIQQRENQLCWADVLRDVNAAIKEHIPSTHQIAYIYNGPGGADPTPRFGVVAEGTPRGRRYQGVEVTRVLSGYPAQSMHRRGEETTYQLVAGRDVIQKVNGKPVASYAEFVNAVRNSSPSMTVTVYDTGNGHTDEFEVTLRDSAGP